MKIRPEEYEKIKRETIRQAEMLAQINRMVPVSGERINLPLGDRTVEIVYYRSGQDPAPLILGFHGGGFIFGGNAMDDAVWSSVSSRLSCHVASVGYRQGPDHQWRASLADAYDTAVYMRDHAEEFGIDPGQISVMGNSAGGCIAASVCLYANQKGTLSFANQILMYPVLDLKTDPAEKGEGTIDGPMMYLSNEFRCKKEEAGLSLVSPLFASDEELKGLPNTILCLADTDSLKAEGIAYGKRLKEAGIPTADAVYEHMPHAFFEYGFGNVPEQAYTVLGEAARPLVENGSIAESSQKALAFVAEHFRRK